jgi:predicted DNA-binding protein with PD1-like motif
MKTLIVLLFVLTLRIGSPAMAQRPLSRNTPEYIKVPSGYLMVLREGDNVLERIKNLALQEQIPSANFSAMGFVNITFGFFNFKTKTYKPGSFRNVELASMNGSIAWQSDSVSIHAHGVATDENFAAHGGHILEAIVSTGSVEILVTVHDILLQRHKEDPPGANVLQLGTD